jgi:hypothetical protein
VDKKINFLWIPSHCNIVGNEEADKEAKKAAEEGETLPLPIPYTDLHPLLHRKQVANWRTHWDESWETIRNKTTLRGPLVTPWYRKVVQQFPLNPFLPWYSKQYYTREFITIITRLRIGHGNYSDHLHIINLKEDNLCECGSEGTLDYIFFNCHLHEEATAQLNLAIENLDLTIDNPRSLTHLLRLNTKQIHDLLVNFIKHDDITI